MAVIRLGNLLWRPHTRPISPEDPVDVKDVNTADIKAKLEMVQSELALVKAELQEVKANQLSGDQKVQLSGTNVAVPVDLQYHDLETPLPVSITNQTSDAVRIVKEYIGVGVRPELVSLYLGQSTYNSGARVMNLLDVSQYRTIVVYVHNRTGVAWYLRGFVFSHLAETHFENGAVMGVWQQGAITISDGEQRYITFHDADKIAELAWFGHVPLPYFGFQLRPVTDETFGEDPAVDAAVIGVVR